MILLNLFYGVAVQAVFSYFTAASMAANLEVRTIFCFFVFFVS